MYLNIYKNISVFLFFYYPFAVQMLQPLMKIILQTATYTHILINHNRSTASTTTAKILPNSQQQNKYKYMKINLCENGICCQGLRLFAFTRSFSLSYFFHINDVKSLSSPSRLIENENRREQEGKKYLEKQPTANIIRLMEKYIEMKGTER